jgi:hypothetical protein
MTLARTRKSDVLDRVAADLAQGRTDPAIRRLASLVAAHPTDLDLRLRLAAAHRLDGNVVEAGRWSYLNPDADAGETDAFERAYPQPAQRLRRLRWPEREGDPATEFARARLAELTTVTSKPARAVGPLAVVCGIVLVALAILGAVTVVQWIIP